MRALLVLAALLCWVGPSQGALGLDPPPHSRESEEASRWVMGTLVRIIVVDGGAVARPAMESAFEVAQGWDQLLSNYDPKSPLSLLNANAGGEWLEIPEQLKDYLLRARNDARRTDGMFDIGVGALVALHQKGQPGSGALAQALEQMGVERLELRSQGSHHFARLPSSGVALDPGGDGKGVALDHMVQALREHGIRRAFIDFGQSTLYGMGLADDDEPWRVLLRDGAGKALGLVSLRDQALSTSSSLLRDRGSGGHDDQLRFHVVDPRWGGLVTAPRTTAVLAPSATDAEVLSTALLVEGAEGLRWLGAFEKAAAGIFDAGRPRALHPEFSRAFEIRP